MSPNVTAILVTYNSASVIGAALSALTSDPDIAEIIVVDNASRDDTRDKIRREFPRVTLVESPENIGFGRGNNLGLERVTTPYALLVNPDAVMAEGAVAMLVQVAEKKPNAAILAPALYNEQGRLHDSAKVNVFERENAGSRKEGVIEFLSGAVMLFNMALMRKVGFFDPKIFLFYEDDDICLRVRQAGYELAYVPAARAMHLMGASGGAPNLQSELFKQRHMAWSRLYIEEKYRGRDAAQALATAQRKKYHGKLWFYRLTLNCFKTARYKGRLEGIMRFAN